MSAMKIERKPGAYVKDPMRYKTQMCQNFAARGRCPYNKKCQFAHGAEELRLRAQLIGEANSLVCREVGPAAAPSAAPLAPPPPPPPPPPPATSLMSQPYSTMPMPMTMPQSQPTILPPPTRPPQLQSHATLAPRAPGPYSSLPSQPLQQQAPPLPPAPRPQHPHQAVPLFPSFLAPEDGEESPSLEHLRFDNLSMRVEAPRVGGQTSFMTESVRRQISFLWDEPDSPCSKEKVLAEPFALNDWVAGSLAARAA